MPTPYVGPVPYAPSERFTNNPRLVDLMVRQGDDRANAIRQQGQASAQMWNAVGQGIQNTVGGVIKAKQDQTRADFGKTQAAAASVDLAEKRKSIADADAFKKVVKDTPMVSENGLSLYDVPTLAKNLSVAGLDPSQSIVHFQQINSAFRAEQQAKLSLVTLGAEKIIAAGNDPTLAHHFLDQLEANGSFPKETIQQYRDFIDADPANVAKLTGYLAGPQKMENAAPGSMARNPLTGQVVEGSQVPERPTAESTLLDSYIGSLKKPKGTPWSALSTDEQAGFPAWKEQIANNNDTITVKTVENGKMVEKVMTKADALKQGVFQSQPPAAVIVNNMTQSNLANLPEWVTSPDRPTGADANKIDPKVGTSPNGLYQDAITSINTGQYPPAGMGSSPAAQTKRAAIDAKIGAIAAEAGMDVPTFRALYKANASSLAQQQKAADSVQSFMSTADKNVALLTPILDKIPDVGIPKFNKPLRDFEKDFAGDQNLSQMAIYIRSAQNEYARIISQPNLSGVLTDSARVEAETLLDPKSTVPQIIKSIEALKAEGANRLQSLGEQIRTIQQRMTQGAQSVVPSNVAAALKGQSVGKHTLSDGSVWLLDGNGGITKAP